MALASAWLVKVAAPTVADRGRRGPPSPIGERSNLLGRREPIASRSRALSTFTCLGRITSCEPSCVEGGEYVGSVRRGLAQRLARRGIGAGG